MQYLSKAYSYYSGINPATLSGAIDVVVIRHVDEQGEVTLSSSPFHVRFGKLRVLRAGEKRVILRLPENLPPPHVAPFSMKVGDSGEAFFVLETQEQVPEELLTSPVVMPTDTELPPSPPPSDEDKPPDTYTQQPFGSTERSSGLAEVEPLDLNAPSGDDPPTPEVPGSSSAPASILSAATSLLPNIPFLSSATNSPRPEATARSPSEISTEHLSIPGEEPDSRLDPQVSKVNQSADLMAGTSAEKVELLVGDHKMSDYQALDADIPRVHEGQSEGPDVVYASDIVLDIAGYHRADQVTEETVAALGGSLMTDTFSSEQRCLVNSLADVLLSNTHRPGLPFRLTDPLRPDTAVLSLDVSLPDDVTLSAPGRSDRGGSEPPPDLPSSSNNGIADSAWDWSNHPERAPMERSKSNPTAEHRNVPLNADSPYLFTVDDSTYEMALCGSGGFAFDGTVSPDEETAFDASRLTFQNFMDDPQTVDDLRLVIRYNSLYITWTTGYKLFYALGMYRRSLSLPPLPPLSDIGILPQPSAWGWSRWWRRNENARRSIESSAKADKASESLANIATSSTSTSTPPPRPEEPTVFRQYAKTLRLSSNQLLNLTSGPNKIQFSVTSSYSGYATCSARLFLWEDTDQVVISDIDGTVTKSDALGHVFAAIGRDWTHPGIAKLYTDISNNGYKMLYLTARAIGQADSTREYLKSIQQGNYRMPEGPVIMSPDRLIASLHREVIMRKPELFKMACLRDIQRLFGDQSKEAFFAGFGNRITDAMSYRSVGIETAKIYTIDSAGVVKTELLQTAGHKGSYVGLNDLVNETFPPVSTKFRPEFTDFAYWRTSIPDIPLPDCSPPSPALSARSDSSRLSVGMLGKFATLGRRSSKPLLPTSNASTRPSSPLMGPALTPDELSEADDQYSGSGSIPGSFSDEGRTFPNFFGRRRDEEEGPREGPEDEEDEENEEEDSGREDSFDDGAIFDDDILATGEMQNVPF